MVTLISNDFSIQIGHLEDLLHFTYDSDPATFIFKPDLYYFPFSALSGPLNPDEKIWLPQIIQKAKEAEVIFLFLQPTDFDFKDPYYNYIPSIYSFLCCHPSFKAKTYLIPPFFDPRSDELREILNEKGKQGDFKQVTFPRSCSLPITNKQIDYFHRAIVHFIEYDLNCNYRVF